jgi:hypothetical protein
VVGVSESSIRAPHPASHRLASEVALIRRTTGRSDALERRRLVGAPCNHPDVTQVLAVLYVVAAACEIAGVGLVVQQYRKAQGRWRAHSEAVAEEQRMLATDLRFRFDPLVARYGITPGEVRRATHGVEALLAPDVREQVVSISLLVAGIVLGAVANLLTL